MASGTGGQIALRKTSSLYLDITSADTWTNFVSENVDHTIEELEEQSIFGRRDNPPSHEGVNFGQGDIVFEPNPNAIGAWVNGAYGTISSSLITAASSTGANSGNEAGKPVFCHLFTPRQAAHSERSFLEPYAVMFYKDTGSAFFHNGAIFPRLVFNYQANALVGATAGLMTRSIIRGERTAAINSLVSSGGRPWLWDMGSFQVASGGLTEAFLASDTNFEQFQMTLDTPHEGVVLHDGTKKYAEFQPNGFRSIRCEGLLSFRDQAAYDAFVNYEPRHLRITHRNTRSFDILGNPSSVQYYTIQHDMPAFKFTSWGASIQGPNRIQARFTGKTEWSDAAGYMIQTKLINVTSFY